MGVFGVAQPVQLLPGDTGTLFGVVALPGTPIVAAGEAIAASAKSRPAVINPRVGGQANTQRTISWQVTGTGSYNFNLQVAMKNVEP